MSSKALLIAITVGVFFVGLGVGYAVLQSSAPVSPMMNQQQMQQMMDNPQTMNQWHQQMMQNPQAMNQWMNTMMDNPQSMNMWMNSMMNNQQAMQSWNQYMMNNPDMMNQWMGHMMDNQQMMQYMMNNPQFQQTWMAPWLSNGTNWNHMMNAGWMNQNMDYGMMGSGMMSGHMMMGNPITKQSDILDTINNIEKILDDVSTNYRNGDNDTALSLATSAYLENYEYIEGAIAQKDSQLMGKIELMLRVDLRSMIKNGDAADNIDMKIDSIKSELTKVKSIF